MDQIGIFFQKVRRRLLEYKYALAVRSQAQLAAAVYDAIFQQLPANNILALAGGRVNQEIISIIKKVGEVGYFGEKILPLAGRPSVSVIIPHYNQTRYLSEALENLSRQTDPADEVIVVDDQSPDFDKVKAVCDKYQQLNLKLLQPKDKLFAGGARRLGVETATSDIVAMHDADDLSHISRIELTRKFFTQYPKALQLDVGLVRDKLPDQPITDFSGAVIDTEELKQAMRTRFVQQRFTSPEHPDRWGSYGVSRNFGVQAAHVAFRRDVSKYLKPPIRGEYVFSKFEDYDFDFILLLTGQASYQLDLPLVYYRIGSSTYYHL